MPTTIYHPSLALGQVVKPEVFDLVKQIATAEDKIEAARERLNSAITLKRSLSMTVTELASINVDTTDLLDALTNADQKIKKAAKSYVSTRIEQEDEVLTAKNKLANMQDIASPESPVDMSRSKVDKFPLGADSLRLDAQYFSFSGQSTQDPVTMVGGVENFVRETATELGPKAASELGGKAARQLKDQLQNHQLAGTLVITASCTHRNAAMLSPLVLDANQAISAWNQFYPNDGIDVHDQGALSSLLTGTSAGRSSNSRRRSNRSGTSGNNSSLRIISGMGQGSGFVGMVHLLKTDSISFGSKGLTELAEQLQERFTISTWLEDASGGIGADQSMMEDIKQLLSTSSVNAHVTLTTVGVIPSVTSNQLQLGLKGITESSDFSNFLQDADQLDDSERSTIKQGSDAAKAAKRAVSMHSATVGQLLNGLGEIDRRSDKVLNINSLMTAFEDYLQEIKKGGVGMPIHFYYRSLTKSDIAELAMRKYFGQQEQETSSPDPESSRPAKAK
ncbi:MAG: hypothetical protein AAFY36_09710 [Bacteroidota bacterium]